MALSVCFYTEIIVLNRRVFIIRRRVDVKEVERFDKRNEFLIPEVTYIKVGKLLIQEIAESAGENPAVFVGVFLRQLDKSQLNGRQVFAESFVEGKIIVRKRDIDTGTFVFLKRCGRIVGYKIRLNLRIFE